MNLNQQILIALPNMEDKRFEKSIILICEHHEDGAMGLVLNKPTDITTEQVFENLELNKPIATQTVIDGGPMNKNSGFVIHNSNDKFKNSINITENLTLTTSKDLLDKISNHAFNSSWKFILGYSSWDKNQLEQEIYENTWLTCPINLNLIFKTPAELQWQKALSLIGINNPNSISGAGHA